MKTTNSGIQFLVCLFCLRLISKFSTLDESVKSQMPGSWLKGAGNLKVYDESFLPCLLTGTEHQKITKIFNLTSKFAVDWNAFTEHEEKADEMANEKADEASEDLLDKEEDTEIQVESNTKKRKLELTKFVPETKPTKKRKQEMVPDNALLEAYKAQQLQILEDKDNDNLDSEDDYEDEDYDDEDNEDSYGEDSILDTENQ